MVLPLVGIAAGVAARALAKKVAQEVAKKATKATVAKTAQIAKNSVKVKPAAKQVGNPPNDIKAWEYYISSVSRGAPGRGPAAGKAKATRVANSKIAKKTVPKANEPSRIPEIPARATVKINTDPTKPKGIFGPLKKKLAAADTPANRAKTANNARGLKAANKPLSKGNKKLVTQIKQQTGYIAMDRRPTPSTVAAALKKGPKGSFILEAKKIAMQESRSMSAPKKISPAQKALNKKN